MDEHRTGYTILIADDDAAVHQSLSAYLKREGYRLLSAYDGEEAIALTRLHHPDMLILDIMLPKKDGFTVCREIRRDLNLPIIMLSTKTGEFDKLLGLELGADDYVIKPFSPREVLARVKTVLRRMRKIQEQSNAMQLTVGNLFIDMSAFSVRLDGQSIPCTPREIEILWALASNPGMVFSRDHLMQSIWGCDSPGDTRAVDSHIKRIRAKLCKPDNPWDIRTVWGIGYRFELI